MWRKGGNPALPPRVPIASFSWLADRARMLCSCQTTHGAPETVARRLASGNQYQAGVDSCNALRCAGHTSCDNRGERAAVAS